jgi:hypothetical protein
MFVATEETAVADRRAAPRRLCVQLIVCQLTTELEADPRPAWVRDVSARGVSLMADRPLVPGTPLLVELPNLDGQACVLTARVVRTVTGSGGQWLLGCTLTHDLGDNELAKLG